MDLEGFDTETFFKILLRQCLSVTTKLSQTKAEVSGEACKFVSGRVGDGTENLKKSLVYPGGELFREGKQKISDSL